MALISGMKLGPYEIEAQLGAGGMGEVYCARDTRLNREVAVKILPPSLSRDHELLRRFEQESRAVAALNHPSILAIFDVGQSDGSPSDLFLDKKKPSYIGGILEMANQRLYSHWSHLTEGLRTGLPQNEVRGGGQPIFETLYADPARLKSFLQAMTGISHGSALAIAAKFPFGDYKIVCDAGTAQGDTAAQIALAHPHLRVIGFDLPEVGPIFEEHASKFGLNGRLTFAPGSFFENPIPEADVIVMGHILHDWDLPTKKALMRKAFDALPSGGAYIAYDAIIDDDRRRNAFGLMMSLNMLIETYGGFDYTGADCQSWMREIGFRETRVEPLAGPDSMVIGIK